MQQVFLIEKIAKKMGDRTTSGFTQAGVYARRQFCGTLEVYRPPEPLWNPRLREAATTLCASGGLCRYFRGTLTWCNLTTQREIQRNLDFAHFDNL